MVGHQQLRSTHPQALPTHGCQMMVHLLVSLLVPMCLLVVHLQGDTALNQLPEVAQSSLPVARHIEGNTVCFECACFMRVCAVGGYRAACSTSICRVRSLMLASMACCSEEICTHVHTQRRFPHKPLPYRVVHIPAPPTLVRLSRSCCWRCIKVVCAVLNLLSMSCSTRSVALWRVPSS